MIAIVLFDRRTEEHVLPINWKNIRTLTGSQAEGFEQLCCQLASREGVSHGAKFTRKGKPDAGVECYWALPTTEEIAWQAKYFLTLGTTQWAQLDESVKTALDKHPKLASVLRLRSIGLAGCSCE